MASYEVKLPIAGYAIVYVQADDEKAAIEQAMNDVTPQHFEEWSAYERIVSGNVFYGPCNDASADLTEADDD